MSDLQTLHPPRSVEQPVAASLVRVKDLTLATGEDETALVSGLSFEMDAGESVGVIGESGSGKSLLVRSMMGLLPRGVRQAAGTIELAGTNLGEATARELRELRGRKAAMVFQDSIGSLDPLFTVGSQISEALRAHQPLSRRAARARAIELLEDVGIVDARERLRAYPHQFSGGMAQRVAIAIAIANSPSLLIADEATTALDVTTQKQVIALLKRIQAEHGCGIIFVSHDLGTVSEIAQRVVVMYAGAVVEVGPTAEVLNRPQHPYTQALLRSRPPLGAVAERQQVMTGSVPSPGSWPAGCRFHPRCPRAEADPCARVEPILSDAPHAAACHFPLTESADDGKEGQVSRDA